jgi:SAM-dependent methyltransferase
VLACIDLGTNILVTPASIGPHLARLVRMALRGSGIKPPTSSLPSLRGLDSVTVDDLSQAIGNLRTIYAPLPRATGFTYTAQLGHRASEDVVDSGYASANEDEDEFSLDVLRADPLERAFTIKWLTGFIARAEAWDPPSSTSDDSVAREGLVDGASALLSSFSDSGPPAEDDADAQGAPAGAIIRRFAFPVGVAGREPIKIMLTDAPLLDADHTAVGLQSWGASIVVGEQLCAVPERFGLAAGRPRRVLELGAGTGVLGIVAARILGPGAFVVATDFHPDVLANLARNVAENAPGILVRALDWTTPDALEVEPLECGLFDVLLAADVVYAPEHAALLRACAARWLAPRGTFWLAAAVRPEGRFAGVVDTVRSAFADATSTSVDARKLEIRSVEEVGKRRGIGRADEVGYRLFEIGWAGVDSL